jgi:hypothetical protein
MRFEKCLTCPSIKGKQCAGPNFMTAPTKEMVEWMLAFQKLNGITNSQWAEKSGIPKGTIVGLKNRADVRHDTIYPLIKALIELSGGVWGGESCPIAVNVSSEQRQEILRLTEENLRLMDELNRAKEERERCARDVRDRNRAVCALFGLCAGLIALLLLLNL